MDDDNMLTVMLVLLVVVIVFGGYCVYATQVANARPHEEVYYVIGYTKGYYTLTNVPMTTVLVSYNVIGLDSDGNLVAETDTKCYGGHYDFEIGQLYKVYSEGNFWWLYRKITMTQTTLDNETIVWERN